MNGQNVVDPVAHQTGKCVANDYCIQISPTYMANILQGFRGKGSAEFFRQHTDELWKPPFSNMSCADYGAFRRILALFTRSKQSIKENMIVVTKKELNMHGISLHMLRRHSMQFGILQISLLTESGEIKDLKGS